MSTAPDDYRHEWRIINASNQTVHISNVNIGANSALRDINATIPPAVQITEAQLSQQQIAGGASYVFQLFAANVDGLQFQFNVRDTEDISLYSASCEGAMYYSSTGALSALKAKVDELVNVPQIRSTQVTVEVAPPPNNGI